MSEILHLRNEGGRWVANWLASRRGSGKSCPLLKSLTYRAEVVANAEWLWWAVTHRLGPDSHTYRWGTPMGMTSLTLARIRPGAERACILGDDEPLTLFELDEGR